MKQIACFFALVGAVVGFVIGLWFAFTLATAEHKAALAYQPIAVKEIHRRGYRAGLREMARALYDRRTFLGPVTNAEVVSGCVIVGHTFGLYWDSSGSNSPRTILVSSNSFFGDVADGLEWKR